MRRGARDSQVINNFFTFGTIVIISIVITLYTKYVASPQPQKEPAKRELITLPCSQDTYSYSKIFNEKLMQNSLDALNRGYFKLDGGYIKALYMKSYLEDFVTLDEVDSYYANAIGVKQILNPQKYVTIKYELIENDKKDPNKKEEDCKLHAGSLQTSFRVNGKEMFRTFTDFRYFDKVELQDIIDCTIRTYKANAK